MKDDLSKVQRIYNIYSELKSFEDDLGSMLWSELDVTKLITGGDQLERKLRTLPKELKKRSTFQAVEECIIAFKEGIPLIQNLKTETMKARHWKKLMDVTGVRFSMEAKSFTLGALLSMNLARFDNEIGEIVNESLQAKIENAIKEIESNGSPRPFLWESTKRATSTKVLCCAALRILIWSSRIIC